MYSNTDRNVVYQNTVKNWFLAQHADGWFQNNVEKKMRTAFHQAADLKIAPGKAILLVKRLLERRHIFATEQQIHRMQQEAYRWCANANQ